MWSFPGGYSPEVECLPLKIYHPQRNVAFQPYTVYIYNHIIMYIYIWALNIHICSSSIWIIYQSYNLIPIILFFHHLNPCDLHSTSTASQDLNSPGTEEVSAVFEEVRVLAEHLGSNCSSKAWLGGGFKYFLFSPLPGEMIRFDEHIFQMGWSHQLVDYCLYIGEF